jgi:hypothetical protein
MSAAELDPPDEAIKPLLQAIGRAVLGAAALEKVLLVDIVQRHAGQEGLSERLGNELSTLERQPAGALLNTLSKLGISPDLGGRIHAVIARRNQMVHHFMEDAEVMTALSTGRVDHVVERVDEIAAACQRLVNQIAPSAFAGMEGALGATLPELIAALESVDLEAIADDRLRAQLSMVRAMIHAQRSGPSGPPPG